MPTPYCLVSFIIILKSGSFSLTSLFFSYKVLLRILGLFHFHKNFRISFSISYKSCWNFYWDCTELFAIFFSRESSQSRDQTHVSTLTGGLFTTEPLGSILYLYIICIHRAYYLNIYIIYTCTHIHYILYR